MTALSTPIADLAPRRRPDLLTYIEQKVRDAQQERRKHEQQWIDNARLTLGDHESVFKVGKNREYVIADHINHTVVLQWSVATETPPRIVFKPRETNEPPEWFLKPTAAAKLDMLPGHGLDMNQAAGLAPIDDAVVQQLFASTVPQQGMAEQPNPETGEVEVVATIEQVPVFDPEADFIAVTDELAAEALSQELASEWTKAGCDEFMAQHIFENIVYGNRDVLFAWDAEEYCGRLVDLYLFNVWTDRWSKTNHDGEYVAIRQVLPIREAAREFPDVPRDTLKQMIASGGNSDGVFGTGAIVGGKYDSISDREVVYRWTLYERHAEFDRDEDDAVERGLVEPLTEMVSVDTPDPVTGLPIASVVEQPQVDEAGQQLYRLIDGVNGFDAFAPDSEGEQTAPGMPNWPKRSGVRQIDLLGDIEIFNGECELSDIPVARNKNIPIADSPHGQGTPHRLAPLQEFENRLISLLREHCQYFANPQIAMPSSVLERMKAEMGSLYATAQTRIGVPDELIHEFGGISNIIHTMDPPMLQEAMVNLLTLIGSMMDRIGGTTDVLRGEAKSDWSGETVGKLQSAARGPIGAMSRATSYMLRYIGGIWANAIIDYLPAQEWSKRNSKYPVQVLEACRQRLKRIGFDVEAEVSGAGSKEVKFERLANLLNNVPTLVQSPTFLKSLLEAAELAGAEKIAQEMIQSLAAPAAPPA